MARGRSELSVAADEFVANLAAFQRAMAEWASYDQRLCRVEEAVLKLKK